MIKLYMILILGAIFMNAFFSAAETALTSSSKIKIKGLADSGNVRAVKLREFLSKKGAYLGTTLVGTNIAVVITAALATRIFSEFVDPRIVPVVVVVVLTPITLLFAEIIPKMIAYQSSERLALNALSPLKVFFRVFYPVIVSINAISSFLLRPFKHRETSWDAAFTKGDIKRLLLIGHEAGDVEADEVELIHKVLDFGTRKVESIMVPLYRVSSIEGEDTVEDLKKLVSLTGFSRVPVYEGGKKNIVGIVNIYDILFGETSDPDKVKNFIRDPAYINRKDPLDIMLARLRHRGQPMGIVTDDSGDVCGIVTIEDALEAIVGKIGDAEKGDVE
ncbi:MAG: hemolysin family protein [Candidatus Aadella gelida]|nr:hemolysin family protein [Candidatus Aadella gelida]